MIKINLLGKKKVAAPFGLDEKLAKLGVKPEDLATLQPALVKVGVIIAGLYVAEYVPNHIYETKMAELDQRIAALNERKNALNSEMASKKDITKKMEQLNKEELDIQRQLNAVNGLQRDRSLAFRSLDNIVTALPPKVWVSRIAYNNRQINIKGSSWEYFPINDFIKTINEYTQYTNVNFKGIETEGSAKPLAGVPEAAQRIKTFDVDFLVKSSTGE